MNYPIVIHKDKSSDYGVSVPDLPGCFSAGDTLDEAIAMAKEAIELHLEGLIEQGMPVPRPAAMERHQKDPRYRGGAWAVVSVDPSSLRVNARRVNITLPQRILEAVDRRAATEGETRSGLLARAAAQYISASRPARSKPPRRRRIASS